MSGPPKLFNPFTDKEEEQPKSFSFYSDPMAAMAPRNTPTQMRGGHAPHQEGRHTPHPGRGPPPTGTPGSAYPPNRGPHFGGPHSGGPHPGRHGVFGRGGGPPTPGPPGQMYQHQAPSVSPPNWQQQQMAPNMGQYATPGGQYTPQGGQYTSPAGQYTPQGGQYTSPGSQYASPGGNMNTPNNSRGGYQGTPGRGQFSDSKVPRTGDFNSPHSGGRGRGRGRQNFEGGPQGQRGEADEMARLYRPTMSQDPWAQLLQPRGPTSNPASIHVGKAFSTTSASPAHPSEPPSASPAGGDATSLAGSGPQLGGAAVASAEAVPPRRSKMLLPRPVNMESGGSAAAAAAAPDGDASIQAEGGGEGEAAKDKGSKPGRSLADIMDDALKEAVN